MAYIVTALIFAVTLIQHPTQSGEWLWDLANGLGYLAFAGMLYLFIEVGASRRFRIHQWISYGILALVIAHILILWVPDTTIWHYLAWNAPLYMWAGVAGALLVIAMIVLALPQLRRWWHLNHNQFQGWHYWLSLTCIVATFWHLAGSGFYLSKLEAWLLGFGVAGLIVAHRLKRLPVPGGAAISLLGLPVFAALFLVLKL